MCVGELVNAWVWWFLGAFFFKKRGHIHARARECFFVVPRVHVYVFVYVYVRM